MAAKPVHRAPSIATIINPPKYPTPAQNALIVQFLRDRATVEKILADRQLNPKIAAEHLHRVIAQLRNHGIQVQYTQALGQLFAVFDQAAPRHLPPQKLVQAPPLPPPYPLRQPLPPQDVKPVLQRIEPDCGISPKSAAPQPGSFPPDTYVYVRGIPVLISNDPYDWERGGPIPGKGEVSIRDYGR